MKKTTTTKKKQPETGLSEKPQPCTRRQAYQAAALVRIEEKLLDLGVLMEDIDNTGLSYDDVIKEEMRHSLIDEDDAYPRVSVAELIATQNVCYALGVAVGRYLAGRGR